MASKRGSEGGRLGSPARNCRSLRECGTDGGGWNVSEDARGLPVPTMGARVRIRCAERDAGEAREFLTEDGCCAVETQAAVCVADGLSEVDASVVDRRRSSIQESVSRAGSEAALSVRA